MSGPTAHGPELRQLARSILGLLAPLAEAGSAFATAADGGAPGTCAQVWCPVCAVAALASGEQHPLNSMIAEHGAALLTLLRAVAAYDDPGPPGGGQEHPGEPPTASARGYQPIEVTVVD